MIWNHPTEPPFKIGFFGYQVLLLKMWIFSKCLSQKGPEKEESSSRSKSCYCLPTSFSDFLKRNDTHTCTHKDIQTSQPGKTHLFLFNKASGWNFCPFRWNEEKTAVTQKLFCTLGDIFTLEVIKDILWRPAEWKSSLKQVRFIAQRAQGTKKVLLVRKAVTVHRWPSPIFAFEVLVLKHNDTHKDMQTSQPGKTHLVLFNKASGWNFCPFRWKNCCYTETVLYSWGHFHPWGDKGYSLKTCRVKVFT